MAIMPFLNLISMENQTNQEKQAAVKEDVNKVQQFRQRSEEIAAELAKLVSEAGPDNAGVILIAGTTDGAVYCLQGKGEILLRGLIGFAENPGSKGLFKQAAMLSAMKSLVREAQ